MAYWSPVNCGFISGDLWNNNLDAITKFTSWDNFVVLDIIQVLQMHEVCRYKTAPLSPPARTHTPVNERFCTQYLYIGSAEFESEARKQSRLSPWSIPVLGFFEFFISLRIYRLKGFSLKRPHGGHYLSAYISRVDNQLP